MQDSTIEKNLGILKFGSRPMITKYINDIQYILYLTFENITRITFTTDAIIFDISHNKLTK